MGKTYDFNDEKDWQTPRRKPGRDEEDDWKKGINWEDEEEDWEYTGWEEPDEEDDDF